MQKGNLNLEQMTLLKTSMLFFYAYYASDQNGKWHVLFWNPTSGHPSFISHVAHPSWLHVVNKKEVVLFIEKGDP